MLRFPSPACQRLIAAAFSVAATAGITALSAASARAQAAIYTFEYPNFQVGWKTPLTGIAPDEGDPSYTATFSAQALDKSFEIAWITSNTLITGQSLYSPAGSPTLTISFARPVSAIRFTYALNSGTQGAYLQSLIGTETRVHLSEYAGGAGFLGGTWQITGGIISPGVVAPFQSVSLSAFRTGGVPTEFQIDNLAIWAADSPSPFPAGAPEPASLVLLLPVLGRVGIAIALRRTSPRGRGKTCQVRTPPVSAL